MADVKWIKITTDMFDDEKIDFIQSLPEADAIIVVWVRLLTLAGKCNAGGYIYLTENIPYEPEMLAHKFRKQINTINLALETFKQLGMIEKDGNGLYISNWEKHQNIEGLDKIREQNKLRVRKHRESLKLAECNVTSNVTVTDSNAIDIDKEIELDKEYIVQQVADIWKAYPNKKGKADSIKKITKLLKDNNTDTILQAIDRYKSYVEERRKTFKEFQYQNGSTFFNKGIEDYIGEDYKEAIQETKPKGWWKLD